MQERLTKIGASEGINFSFNSRLSSTRDSHRLIELAKAEGESMQTSVMEALLKGYFEEGGDITDGEWLVKRGVEGRLEEKEERAFLLE